MNDHVTYMNESCQTYVLHPPTHDVFDMNYMTWYHVHNRNVFDIHYHLTHMHESFQTICSTTHNVFDINDMTLHHVYKKYDRNERYDTKYMDGSCHTYE